MNLQPWLSGVVSGAQGETSSKPAPGLCQEGSLQVNDVFILGSHCLVCFRKQSLGSHELFQIWSSQPLTSLCLSFSSYKMGLTIYLVYRVILCRVLAWCLVYDKCSVSDLLLLFIITDIWSLSSPSQACPYVDQTLLWSDCVSEDSLTFQLF